MGSRAFLSDRFIGIGMVYDLFPERLLNVVLAKNTALFKELYGMLTDEEKEIIEEEFPEQDELSSIEKRIDQAQKKLETLINDPYNTPEARQNRFKDMPPTTLQASERDFQEKVEVAEGYLSSLLNTKNELLVRSQQAALFD